MSKKSAGILLYRLSSILEVFLVHPGGPFFKKKDAGFWTIPKGEVEEGEDTLQCAIREFREEIGTTVSGPFLELTAVKQKSGKWVYAWAVQGDINPEQIRSNSFVVEWPRGSGRHTEFPEIDKAAWFTLEEAMLKINEAQRSFVMELSAFLGQKEKA